MTSFFHQNGKRNLFAEVLSVSSVSFLDWECVCLCVCACVCTSTVSCKDITAWSFSCRISRKVGSMSEYVGIVYSGFLTKERMLLRLQMIHLIPFQLYFLGRFYPFFSLVFSSFFIASPVIWTRCFASFWWISEDNKTKLWNFPNNNMNLSQWLKSLLLLETFTDSSNKSCEHKSYRRWEEAERGRKKASKIRLEDGEWEALRSSSAEHRPAIRAIWWCWGLIWGPELCVW